MCMYYAAGSKHHASIIFGITHKHNADRIGISFSIMLQNLSFIVFNETFYEKKVLFFWLSIVFSDFSARFNASRKK